MIKRPFICLSKPQIAYELIGGKAMEPVKIPKPKTATMLLEGALTQKNVLFKTGDSVKTGQKISLSPDGEPYVISSVTGTISSVAPFIGDFGKSYTSISIDAAGVDAPDEQFRSQSQDPSLAVASNFLSHAPGNPCFNLFGDPQKPIDAIVVFGGNADLLIATNQYVILRRVEDVAHGIDILKKITGVEKVIMAVPRDLVSGFGHIGAELAGVDLTYPSAHPKVIMHKVLGRAVPAGKSCEDMGVAFMSAEAAASIGKAFSDHLIPVEKTVTLVKKDGTKMLVSARIGTPLKDIFTACGVVLNEKDRLIIGGPLTGSSIYSEDYPVGPDTDAVIVQDKADISLVSDYPCINCGECVRICPAKMPVNMLVRFLEAGIYETAADEYDLFCCIDCGLCSVVCVSKIPIYQYIRLAKHELGRVNKAEATNEP